MAEKPWEPWAELRSRRHVKFRLTSMPAGVDGLYAKRGLVAIIVVDARLGRRQRKAALAHELVHDERGIVYNDDTPDSVVEKEEAAVQAETVRRLVPMAGLDALAASGEQLEAWQVAEHFDVPDEVARAAVHRWWQVRGCG